MQFELLERCRDRGSDRAAELVELFRASFTASEGEVQGGLIAALVGELCEGMEGSEILCCGAVDAGRLVGAIFFTRLRFADESLIYLLSPVAVSTARQRSGVGQALIRFGLDAIAARGALAAITYGDPA